MRDASRCQLCRRREGLDQTLRTVAAEPFGTALLLAVAVGLVAYGLYSFVEARFRRV